MESSFEDSNDRPEKPRRFGMTEIRGPYHSSLETRCIQDILEATSYFVDGLKFVGGSTNLLPREFFKEVIDLAHQHAVYVNSGGWGDYTLSKGPSSFKQYVQDCKDVGFDIVEFDATSQIFPEEDLLRLIRLLKSAGLKAKPQFEVPTLDLTDTISTPPHSGEGSRIDAWIRKAERCLEAGADMILFDGEGITKNVEPWRTDIVARVISRLGLDRIMFQVDESNALEWFIRSYGSKVNLYVDHSQVNTLECLRSGAYGTRSDWGRRRTQSDLL